MFVGHPGVRVRQNDRHLCPIANLKNGKMLHFYSGGIQYYTFLSTPRIKQLSAFFTVEMVPDYFHLIFF